MYIIRIIVLSLLVSFNITTFAGTTERLPEIKVNKTTLDSYAQGSGFFINEKGYIATAAHVVEDAINVKVLYKNAMRDARIVAIDVVRDLAIIKIKDDVGSTPFYPLAKAPNPKQTMYVIGFPAVSNFGLYPHVTSGTVSKMHILFYNNVFEMHTLACHGNSGGLVTNYEGVAVGMLVLGFDVDNGLCSNVTGANYLDGLIKLASDHGITTYSSNTYYNTPEQAALYQTIRDTIAKEKVVFIEVRIKD